MIVVRRDLVEAYLRQRSGTTAARRAYEAWLAISMSARWRTPIDVKRSHPKASILKRGRVVFNIKANDYRLVAQINYAAGTLEIRFFGSHGEYDRVDAETV
jgi:mRNA interferase HigB